MIWANFLHIYQPIDQTKEILTAVANQSYRRLFSGFRKIPKMKLTLNINAALSEALIKNGFDDIVEDIKALAEEGKIEFAESAKYHAFLPLLSEKEIERQLIINNQVNKKIFGKIYQPKCVFPPEMAYSEKVVRVASKLNYPIILLDEISYNGKNEMAPCDKLFKIKNYDSIAVFRQRRMSNLIMSGVVRDKKSFFEELGEEFKENKYLVTAMDGETFGHHRPGLEELLFEVMSSTAANQVFISEIPGHFDIAGEISLVEATWAANENDIQEGKQFFSWKDPKNKIHFLQWQFLNFALEILEKQKIGAPEAREKMDRALASDQFFWASGEPWWSIEMIENGAWKIFDALKSMPTLSGADMAKAQDFYNQILNEAFTWQRKGKIGLLAEKYKEDIKIPFKERTLEAGKPEVYQAFIDTMKKKMEEAAQEQNFEKAILWRDAAWKLETKNDIYDAIHVTNLLRREAAPGELEKIMDEYKDKYNKIKSGQPELRGIN
ncbi:UvrB/UvrC motif-containing protein [Candidatus Parcubacteria bacterium]|nr:UvrB/UvrC motif-containing protein [Patescibacteria group bacterium]MBU4477250.1 UvrB/UvrC motif-containing protein [Patescibacteria group bacterium]MCG2699349.1 UvrB/UvrC motif-containing protein [Candidatus Parcubacteria bacterium]